jgi:hypothetical protein
MCDKCLYRKNCQFLFNTRKRKTEVAGCTAFKSEADMEMEIANAIFDDIDASLAVHAFTSKSEDYADGAYDTIEWVDSKIDELREKYVGGQA